jgi:hypothetical protein
MDVVPVEDDDTYTKHLSLLILGWVVVTMIVAIIMAVIVITQIG